MVQEMILVSEKIAIMLAEDIIIIIVSLVFGLPVFKIVLILFVLLFICCSCNNG